VYQTRRLKATSGWHSLAIRGIVDRWQEGFRMQWDGMNIAFIETGDDFCACARTLLVPYGHEFTIHPVIAADEVESATWAGFMPMAMNIATVQGPHAFLTPKLHRERCLLDPLETHVPRTVRRESRRYGLSLNRAFREVILSCVEVHGDGWLLPELVGVFQELHDNRATRQVAFISVELWSGTDADATLVAGEIGYVTGSSYASLTGFSRVPGAGSVQLSTLGAVLAGAGIKVWDLGMEMDYKRALGGRRFPRARFLSILERSYRAASASIREALLPASAVSSARLLLDRGRSHDAGHAGALPD
jgi:Leu/Phe-tRNA-protein transferase